LQESESCSSTVHRLDGQTFNARPTCIGGMEFKSRAGLTLHRVAKRSPPLQYLRK